jgi:hypothetical protein
MSDVNENMSDTRSVDDQVEWLDNDTVLDSILRSTSGARGRLQSPTDAAARAAAASALTRMAAAGR